MQFCNAIVLYVVFSFLVVNVIESVIVMNGIIIIDES